MANNRNFGIDSWNDSIFQGKEESISFIAAAIVLAIVVSFAEIPICLKAILIAFAVVMIIAVALVAVGIEQKAGYYECQHCHHRYVPTYWQVNFAVHSGRTRYMKCPKCGKRS